MSAVLSTSVSTTTKPVASAMERARVDLPEPGTPESCTNIARQ